MISHIAAKMLARAREQARDGQFNAANEQLSHVMVLEPRCAEAYLLTGVIRQMQGDHAAALDVLRKALIERSDDAMIHMHLGISLFETHDFRAAIAAFRRACEVAPGMAPVWYNLGKALCMDARYSPAREAFERALLLNNKYIAAQMGLAEVQIILGEIDNGIRNYRDVLRQQPENATAWYALANLKACTFEHSDRGQITEALKRSSTAHEARVLLGFSLAKALEDQRDFEGSLAVLRQANREKRTRITWNAADHRVHIDWIMAAFAQRDVVAKEPALGREVIFIVSIPRSGSTLVEQILASHPEVEGAGEITDLPQVIEDESQRRGCPFPQWVTVATREDWARLGHDYLTRTERWRRTRPYSTDKNLVTWKLVGAIAAMLPGARIVNCHRDPLEACFACYRQLFSKGAEFSYDIDDMVDYCHDYKRLLDRWQQQYPGTIFDLAYEALLLGPEVCIRRLLTYCGLEFDAACLTPERTVRPVSSTASAAQVRQPIQRDTSRARHYGNGLDDLRRALQAVGLM